MSCHGRNISKLRNDKLLILPSQCNQELMHLFIQAGYQDINLGISNKCRMHVHPIFAMQQAQKWNSTYVLSSPHIKFLSWAYINQTHTCQMVIMATGVATNTMIKRQLTFPIPLQPLCSTSPLHNGLHYNSN